MFQVPVLGYVLAALTLRAVRIASSPSRRCSSPSRSSGRSGVRLGRSSRASSRGRRRVRVDAHAARRDEPGVGPRRLLALPRSAPSEVPPAPGPPARPGASSPQGILPSPSSLFPHTVRECGPDACVRQPLRAAAGPVMRWRRSGGRSSGGSRTRGSRSSRRRTPHVPRLPRRSPSTGPAARAGCTCLDLSERDGTRRPPRRTSRLHSVRPGGGDHQLTSPPPGSGRRFGPATTSLSAPPARSPGGAASLPGKTTVFRAAADNPTTRHARRGMLACAGRARARAKMERGATDTSAQRRGSGGRLGRRGLAATAVAVVVLVLLGTVAYAAVQAVERRRLPPARAERPRAHQEQPRRRRPRRHAGHAARRQHAPGRSGSATRARCAPASTSGSPSSSRPRGRAAGASRIVSS